MASKVTAENCIQHAKLEMGKADLAGLDDERAEHLARAMAWLEFGEAIAKADGTNPSGYSDAARKPPVSRDDLEHPN